ncbi:MAG: hypothetical protein EOQ55_00490 [Mesorhizobium sp.]|uniref:hypothetical protein n=1 Tax=Mesorhizobium sp. TaxID=1871066 RepID=UPI000FEA5945|nr:hypothetical protein [Mesorhizobium sp.]RWG23269.1 MAG: hypothetical protein EOQ55_00490 [Mesorhizobium sp.]TIM70297.1 MAG: hypothetical protein E5Y52_02820 [Mesorhizobium sp.]
MEIIKLNDLSRWASIAPGEVIRFSAGNPRSIRLKVNCRFQTSLFIVHADKDTGELTDDLLVTVPAGISLVEFVTGSNPFRISADGSDPVRYYTAEMEPTAVEVADPVSFTKIAHRRARNPELEEMMFLMNQNMERRLAIMDQDHARQIAALKEKGIEDAEVVRTGGNLHIGAPTQREELAEEAEAEPATPPVRGRAPRKATGGATPAGDDDSGEAGGGEA